MGFANKVKQSGDSINAILVIGFLGIVWLMIFGNLTGNLGFTAGSQGANDTNSVITNLTGGVKTFFSTSNTWFTILGIVLLITILLGLLKLVMEIAQGRKERRQRESFVAY